MSGGGARPWTFLHGRGQFKSVEAWNPSCKAALIVTIQIYVKKIEKGVFSVTKSTNAVLHTWQKAQRLSVLNSAKFFGANMYRT